MKGHDDELTINSRNRRIFTATVSLCWDLLEGGDLPGLGMNASSGVEESVRDLIILFPMADIALGSC
jgi:hypothetical protein